MTVIKEGERLVCPLGLDTRLDHLTEIIEGNSKPGMKEDLGIVKNLVQELVTGQKEVWKRLNSRPAWSITVFISVLCSIVMLLLGERLNSGQRADTRELNALRAEQRRVP